MSRLAILNRILEEGVVSIIRMEEAEKVPKVIYALQEGGLSALEITLGTPKALQLIESFAGQKELIIGVGSVLDAESARMAILSGAQFIVTPVSKQSVIEMAHRYDVPIFSGAFSPGEILAAFEWGADVIKVFPADTLGMDYFKAVKAPMPQLQLMPTGGVTLTNAGEWLKAGACAVGIGSALTDKKAIADENYKLLTANAVSLLASIQAGRG
jgi:2-dehydro-3-deoxyphosphogluconate aldolase / (4S)-4-hydroxy-2-oxoglutarate aldolase